MRFLEVDLRTSRAIPGPVSGPVSGSIPGPDPGPDPGPESQYLRFLDIIQE